MIIAAAAVLLTSPPFVLLFVLISGEPADPLPIDEESWLDRERGGRGRGVMGDDDHCSIVLPGCLAGLAASLSNAEDHSHGTCLSRADVRDFQCGRHSNWKQAAETCTEH